MNTYSINLLNSNKCYKIDLKHNNVESDYYGFKMRRLFFFIYLENRRKGNAKLETLDYFFPGINTARCFMHKILIQLKQLKLHLQ